MSPDSTPAQTGWLRKATDGLLSVARRLRKAGWSRVQALHGALGLYLTIGLGASGLLLWGFAELTDEVLKGDTLAFDGAVLQWLSSHRSEWLTRVAIEMTALGSMPVIAVIGLTLTVVLVHLGKTRHVALIWIAWTGSVAINGALKSAFGRTRPDMVEPLVDVGFLSFPSGHAMNSMVFYTVIAYVLGHIVGPGAPRRAIYAFGIFLVTTVGLTRMYLGVHYPSDILGGYAVGYAWAMLCAIVAEAWGRSIPRQRADKAA